MRITTGPRPFVVARGNAGQSGSKAPALAMRHARPSERRGSRSPATRGRSRSTPVALIRIGSSTMRATLRDGVIDSLGKALHRGEKYIRAPDTAAAKAEMRRTIRDVIHTHQRVWRQQSFADVAGIWLNYTGSTVLTPRLEGRAETMTTGTFRTMGEGGGHRRTLSPYPMSPQRSISGHK